MNEKPTEVKNNPKPRKPRTTVAKVEPVEEIDVQKLTAIPEKAPTLSPIEELKQKKIVNLPEEEPKPTEEELFEQEVKAKKEKKIKKEEEKPITRYLNTPILEGLSNEIVEERKAEGLVNVAKKAQGKSIPGIIFSNLFTWFNILYTIITILFSVLESWDNLGFLFTIIPNLIIGIIQEIKAKMTVDKLSLLTAPTTTVVRNSEKFEIPVSEVVLDDIVFYTPGKQISADSIVVEGTLEVNESLLTGESEAVIKNVGNPLLAGSFVVSGVAVARVDKVGKDNYIEKLSADARMYRKPKSELLTTLNWIIRIISFIILPLAILTYITTSSDAIKDFLNLGTWAENIFGINAGYLLNRDGVIKAGSSILAMIPAGLFLLTSMALAVGVIRLGKSKTLVQELYCIEMLARINVLCLDKTGTITDGTMRVCDCVEIKNYTDYTIREIVGSMMNAFNDTNPTSEALIRFFDKNKVLAPTEIIPFSSKRKYSAVTFGRQGTFLLGAPEFILFENYDKVQSKVERFAQQGCRVLALGHTTLKIKEHDLPKTIKPLALIVIQDHIRDDAADTIAYFKHNGVEVKVISGDNPMTVSEIALRAGVENAERFISLAGLTDDQVRESVFDYTVFGRVSPVQKRIIIQTLKKHKKVVAMTGDGVNDILALKEADCSIAMASGSEATRYVSHLVLMDSNFSSMPKVVDEGRRVINNIQKTSTLFLTKTIFSILLTILYIVFAMQSGPYRITYPFTAKNLYMIEWFALGVPAFVLALQPNHEIVKGKFLTNVLKSTLPGALTVVFFHLLLILLRPLPGFESLQNNPEVYTTITTIITTAVVMIVLFQMSRPFNWFRKLLYTLMLAGCLVMGTGLIKDWPIIPDLELTFLKNPKDYDTRLTIIDTDDGEEWLLNDELTGVKAFEYPVITLTDSEAGITYMAPVITINKDHEWIFNGNKTGIKADSVLKFDLSVRNGYWYLDNVKTIKATKQPILNFDALNNQFEEPILTVDDGYWCLNDITTQIKAGNEDQIDFAVNEFGFLTMNGKETKVMAEPKDEIINANEYLIPEIQIVTVDQIRVFKINNVTTTIPSNDANNITLTVNNEGYWEINGINTNYLALKISDTIVDDTAHVKADLEISIDGHWIINGEETTIKVDNHILILEIVMTLLLVALAYSIMWGFSSFLRKIKMVPEQ
ncbi:MAG: HAD-IC family P-type ATPase [Bacilli bacterium]